jgi:hypothetical protein
MTGDLMVTPIACNTAGTFYPLLGIKRDTDLSTKMFLRSVCADFTSAAKVGKLFICLNPTLSAALSYTADGGIKKATATNQTITDVGELIAVFAMADAVSVQNIDIEIPRLASDEIVIGVLPYTTSQNVAAGYTLIVKG